LIGDFLAFGLQRGDVMGYVLARGSGQVAGVFQANVGITTDRVHILLSVQAIPHPPVLGGRLVRLL